MAVPVAVERFDPSWEWARLASRADAAMEIEAEIERRHHGRDGGAHHRPYLDDDGRSLNLTGAEALVRTMADVEFNHHYGDEP